MQEVIEPRSLQEIYDAVYDAVLSLAEGTISVQKATAIFNGAKELRLTRVTPDDAKPVPKYCPPEIGTLLEHLQPGEYTFPQITAICREKNLFSRFIEGSATPEGFALTGRSRARFGLFLGKFAPLEQPETYTVGAEEYQFYTSGTARSKRYILEKL